MRSFVFVLLLLCAAMAAPPKWDQLKGYKFDQYINDFRKKYVVGTPEYARRKRQFDAKLKEIQTHNNGHHSYRLGVNQFTDWTTEELKRLTPTIGATQHPATPRKNQRVYQRKVTDGINRRRTVDWRDVTPPVLSAVKDQGYCGSCWAFSSTATLESHWAIATGNLFQLSPQQLVSCVPPVTISPDVMQGCDGYLPNDAMDYLVGSNGLTEEQVFPYTSYFAQNVSESGQWGACNWRSTLANTPISGYVQIPMNDQDGSMDAVASEGPLTAIMYVMNDFFNYEGGVYDNPDCISSQMFPSHVVQIIGYGHDFDLGVDYWLVRNSWSPVWGENGFFRLLKTTPAQCGTMQWPTPGPNPSWNGNTTSCGMCGIVTTNLYPIVSP